MIFKWYIFVISCCSAATVFGGCTENNPGFSDIYPWAKDSSPGDQQPVDGTLADSPKQPPRDGPPKPPDKKLPKDKTKPADSGKDIKKADTFTPPDLTMDSSPPADGKVCPPHTDCTYYAWAGGKCTPVHNPAGNPCDDKNACTIKDTCNGKGTCAGTTFGCKPHSSEKRACGNCGSQTRTCSASCGWSSWTACAGQGTCKPSTKQQKICGSCGTQTSVCSSSCQWGAWGACSSAGICKPGETKTQACGKCGSQSRSCSSKCIWSSWSSCAGEKACTASLNQIVSCGKCGSKTRSCSSSCAWGSWSSCTGEKACTAGSKVACTGTNACGVTATGTKTCSSLCAWGSCVIAKPSKCTLTVLGTEDAYIRKDHPTTNYGITNYLLSYPHSSRDTRIYAKFNVPHTMFAKKKILKASLVFRAQLHYSLSICAYAALMPSTSLPGAAWTEPALTWNNRPADGTCTGTSAALSQQKGAVWTISNSDKRCVFDATQRVQCWANGTPVHGLVVGNYQFASYNVPQARWYTKGMSSNYRPYLFIEYQP